MRPEHGNPYGSPSRARPLGRDARWRWTERSGGHSTSSHRTQGRKARCLWPEPLVLAGTLVWAVYGTLLPFDVVLTVCVLVGLIGLVDARRGHRRGFVLVAIGVGCGMLAKGPVVLIHVMPAAILGGWWDVRQPTSAEAPVAVGPAGLTWVAGMSAAILAGAAIALAWAVPAAIAGGPAYARAIFVGQTAGRVVRSFAHRRPLWWYI